MDTLTYTINDRSQVKKAGPMIMEPIHTWHNFVGGDEDDTFCANYLIDHGVFFRWTSKFN